MLATLFTAFQIQSSLHSGSLSLPVTYDDVGYFNDALARLDVLYRHGGRALLAGFWVNPPHAPLQTLLALMGFGLLGPHPWAADAMNAVPLTLILRLFLGFATRSLSLGISTLLAAALLGFPLFGLLVLEFRPDMLCALLTTVGALTIAADPRWRAGDRKMLAVSSALFVGALLTKPTLAPITAVVFAAAAVAAMASQREHAKAIARLALICGGIGVLLVLPYYAAVLPSLFAYIWSNAFGSQASIWAKNAATPNPALYYLTGPGGKVAIGTPWLALGTSLLVVSLPILFRTWRAAVAVLAVALVAYLGVTVPSMKSPFIGVVVPAFMLGIVALVTVALAQRMPRRVAIAAAAGLFAFSVVTWRPVALRLFGAPVPPIQAQNFTRIYLQTADAIAAIPDLGQHRLYFPVIAQYLNLDNLAFELRRRGMQAPVMEQLYLNADLADHRAAMARADLAILFSDDSELPLPWPASTGVLKEIGASVRDSGAFEVVATIDSGYYRGQVLVLKRK
ncbi:hypothetical protein [Variovorax rhizosphaerae]|uniref:Glycosyltransferase RgtA/B/C/D-like domain-containing protein n=1 Tax=Variovorax rhizosphaerae TaxID=1836200 RepID=A0ABU8WHW5_9BURK